MLSVNHNRASIFARGRHISSDLPNKPVFIQEVYTFSQEGNKIIPETIGAFSCLKIKM